MAGKPHTPRNYLLPGGIPRYSRSAMYRRRALYKKQKTVVRPTKPKREHYKVQPVKGEKNGEKRIVLLKKSPRYYPTEDVPRKLRTRKKPKPPQLRKSLTPGTVVVLLSGRHRGKRVVFLKQLVSGLLLVTGPFCVNGVPLRRVCQAYVIATHTKADINSVELPEHINDEYFRRSVAKRKKTGDIFAQSDQGYSASEQRRQDQKTVDDQMLPCIKAIPRLKHYLSARFSLHKGQYPHRMVF